MGKALNVTALMASNFVVASRDRIFLGLEVGAHQTVLAVIPLRAHGRNSQLLSPSCIVA